MPFIIKSRRPIETPLEAEYKKQIALHVRDNDPSTPKFPPTQLRSFALLDDVVTLTSDQSENSSEMNKAVKNVQVNVEEATPKNSEPVTPAEKNELGIFSVRV